MAKVKIYKEDEKKPEEEEIYLFLRPCGFTSGAVELISCDKDGNHRVILFCIQKDGILRTSSAKEQKVIATDKSGRIKVLNESEV
ncbi:MAG: hypothetical protein PHW73_08905 [Atribacterota bacterium]|jgi:hypothetical protein|nr:hypothetical protein [Atribacterota bacterium]